MYTVKGKKVTYTYTQQRTRLTLVHSIGQDLLLFTVKDKKVIYTYTQ